MTPAALLSKLRSEKILAVKLRVIPKSSKNEIAEVLGDGALKVKVTAAPEKGKANQAVCYLLAEFFGVPKRNVEIVRGETSQTKHAVIRVQT